VGAGKANLNSELSDKRPLTGHSRGQGGMGCGFQRWVAGICRRNVAVELGP
jgi:hypothetical protein